MVVSSFLPPNFLDKHVPGAKTQDEAFQQEEQQIKEDSEVLKERFTEETSLKAG